MTRKLLRLTIAALGGVVGVGLIISIDSILVAFGGLKLGEILIEGLLPWVYAFGVLLFAIIFFILSPRLIDSMSKMLRLTEERLTTMPLTDVMFTVVGLITGLLVALLVSTLLHNIPLPWLVTPMSILLYVVCGYLGVVIALKRRGEPRVFSLGRAPVADVRAETTARPKILDTSVIIDGRILDICETGVIEGVLVVPGFVLQELRHIADSADALKRGRGRRGLDILQRMQKSLVIPVKIEERNFDEVAEVDLKLLKLAQDIDGVVVTNDYNLNKVASVQSVPVFNINDLANAMKPVVLPGEEMHVTIVKEGKESGQGVGYLDDGTMIVVEGGRRLIGEGVTSVVTSVLQTSAGRMIFAKVK